MVVKRKRLYQKLLWIPAAIPANTILGYTIPLIDVNFTEKYPDRPHIWTLYLHTDQNNPPQLPYYPKHHENAFSEDYCHDWNITRDGKLKYNSRVSEGSHWALLEFINPISEFYREC